MKQHDQREAYWREHIERCRALGLTLKAYGAQEGLTLSTLYGWNRRLKREPRRSSVFQRVHVERPSSTAFRLHLPNGRVLEWEGEADLELVGRLAETLE